MSTSLFVHFSTKKTDKILVTVSDRAGQTFEPDMEESGAPKKINLHTQMYQNLKLTLFFLEDLGGTILIVSTKKNLSDNFL
jgi:hypothetical protein